MKVSALKNQPPSSVAVKGIITQSGKKWFRVRFEEYEAWLPRSDFAGRGHRAMEKLAAREIVFIGSKAWSDFMIQVIAINRFHKRKLIEQPGWTDCVFALPNGQVFSPSHKSRTITVFEPDHEKCIRAGTLDGWLNEVAHPLTGQNIAIFLLMLAFVPPLLKIIRRSGNFGVEIVGPKGSGKTFLLHLMSSVIGGAVEGDEPSYWVRFNTTVNAIEDLAEAHSDLPLILDDATSFAAESGPVNKGQRLFAAVFGLAQSQGKFRKGEKRPQSFRTIYAVTSNRTLADVIAAIDREEAEAAGDRLLTLNLNLCDNRNFDFIPADFADGTAFSRFLTSGMACQHGTAMPQFLQKLVDHRYADETKLREGIQLRIDELLRELRLDPNDGSQMRQAESFGLALAAGQLAQHYGALPKEYDCQAAAIACYHLFRASTNRLSHIERLYELATNPGVIDLDARAKKYASDKELRLATGFVRSTKNGRREFMVHPKTLRTFIPDDERFLCDKDVAKTLGRDGRHNTKRRRLVQGGERIRVHCFVLPLYKATVGN